MYKKQKSQKKQSKNINYLGTNRSPGGDPRPSTPVDGHATAARCSKPSISPINRSPQYPHRPRFLAKNKQTILASNPFCPAKKKKKKKSAGQRSAPEVTIWRDKEGTHPQPCLPRRLNSKTTNDSSFKPLYLGKKKKLFAATLRQLSIFPAKKTNTKHNFGAEVRSKGRDSANKPRRPSAAAVKKKSRQLTVPPCYLDKPSTAIMPATAVLACSALKNKPFRICQNDKTISH